MKFTKVFCAIICAVILFLIIIYISWGYVILPTKSRTRTLTFVNNGLPAPDKIVLSYTLNNKHMYDYGLNIDQIGYQTAQEYDIPDIENGIIHIFLQLKDDGTIDFGDIYADELYKNGMLIYFYTDLSHDPITDTDRAFDRYVYFISGKNRKCFCKTQKDVEWQQVQSKVGLKKIVKEAIGYCKNDNGIIKNKWIMSPVSEE